jgi:hypothetical protein
MLEVSYFTTRRKFTQTIIHYPQQPTHFLVRLYLVSIIEHAKAWLSEDRKMLGDDPGSLMNTRTG